METLFLFLQKFVEKSFMV